MKYLAVFTIVVLFQAGLFGAEGSETLSDVNTIVHKANIVAYYQGNDGKAKVKMTITDKKGRTTVRPFLYSADFHRKQMGEKILDKPIDSAYLSALIRNHDDAFCGPVWRLFTSFRVTNAVIPRRSRRISYNQVRP